MFRPTGFADLTGRRVGIFGYGVEGRATQRRLRGVTDHVVIVDDDPRGGDVLASAEGGLDALMTCEVVLKSPGIARRRLDVLALEAAGVCVTSALNLWLRDVDRSRVIAVTGTKGKSTTTALIAFTLRALGEDAHELGNFGTPPYDPDLDLSEGWLVLEVSSYQAVDLEVAPALVVVTSLGSDHLDWHGSLAQYHEDKLTLTRAAGEHVTLLSDDPDVLRAEPLMGGDLRPVGPDRTGLATYLGLLGAHNDHNVGLALAAAEVATGQSAVRVREALREHGADFVPLRGRLTLLGAREGVRYVDDGLATGPLPTIAALEVFADDDVALIAGGFDRGVDYSPLAVALAARDHATTLVVFGPAGESIAAACATSKRR